MNAQTAIPATDRYYLHGDPIEGNPDSFYCQRCDRFVDRAHFDGCELGTVARWGNRYIETHEWRFVTLRRKILTTFERGDRRRVVDDLENLFRTGTASEQGLPRLVTLGVEPS